MTPDCLIVRIWVTSWDEICETTTVLTLNGTVSYIVTSGRKRWQGNLLWKWLNTQKDSETFGSREEIEVKKVYLVQYANKSCDNIFSSTAFSIKTRVLQTSIFRHVSLSIWCQDNLIATTARPFLNKPSFNNSNENNCNNYRGEVFQQTAILNLKSWFRQTVIIVDNNKQFSVSYEMRPTPFTILV